MDNTIMPIIVVPAIPTESGGIKFLHYKEEIEIDNEMAPIVWKILSECNGLNTAEEIANNIEHNKDLVLSVISDLMVCEVLEDTNKQYLHFHKVSSFPSLYYPDRTQEEIAEHTFHRPKNSKEGSCLLYNTDNKSSMEKIIHKRHSVRSFSNEKLCVDDIGNICKCAYSITEHSVPSGGGLYPLKIYVLVEDAQEGIDTGYYEYDSINDRFICFNKEVDIEQLKFCFSQTTLPFGSKVQIIIACDFERQSFKYGNRGYRLSLIEAGHAAENIALYCTEKNIGSCELGGILDDALMKELELTDIYPILGIAIGFEKKDTTCFNELAFVEKYLKSPNGPIIEYSVMSIEEEASYFGVTATFGTGDLDYSGATSTSSANAIFKACVEGYERSRSMNPRIDFVGSANEINGIFINPYEYFPLTEEQITKCKLLKFTNDTITKWTTGRKFNNETVYIPSDFIYFPENSEYKMYYSSSSGIAAYTGYEEAQKKALEELIERDALMKTWYTRVSPDIVTITNLPLHIKKRVEYWKKRERDVFIMILPSEYALVVHTVIIGKEFPYISTGASASIDNDFEKAVNKAFQEAEYYLITEMTTTPNGKPIPEKDKVFSPIDHGLYYQSEKRLKEIDWLWSGKIITDLPYYNYTFTDLMKELDVITVDLSEHGFPIKVVRVLSAKLIPISFGTYLGHYTHPKLHNIYKQDSVSNPHYFA